MDKKAPSIFRASAQGFFNLLTYGAGMLIGNYVLGWWGDNIQLDGSSAEGWFEGAQAFWVMPGIVVFIVALFFFSLSGIKIPMINIESDSDMQTA